VKIPMTNTRFDIIAGYSAHHRMPSQAGRLIYVERGSNWFIARLGSLALKVWR
jgi:hypothetical protein